MFFLLFLSNIQCKKALADPIPTPETYPLSVSTRIMDISGPNTCVPKDPDCPLVNFSSPTTYKCGQICWGESSETTFSYTFKGVQFLVYGNKNSENKKFDLYFDNVKLTTLDEQQDQEEPYALLYTSKVYPYGEHTIKAQGIQGQRFSIFKFAFWPHLKSRRLNISDMESTGRWKLESDEIGGIRMFSQSQGASKSLTIEASKLWVYGTPDPGHGKLRISFNAIDQIVNTAYTRKDGTLMFESSEIPTTFHQLDLVAVESKPVLIYCVYYLYDPPEPTRMPYPSRSPIPDTNKNYIDKFFTGDQIGQINNGKDEYKNVKQISGCTFNNIKSTFTYFIRLNSPILFYDNRVEFDVASFQHAAPLFLTSYCKGSMTISRCTFIKCVSKDSNDGNVVNIRGSLDVFFEDCRFVNCYAEGKLGQAVVQVNDVKTNFVNFTDCIFQFSTATSSCQAFDGDNSKLIFSRCTFSKCGAAILKNDVNQFEFTDNVVTSAGQEIIRINNLLNVKPIITGNTFKFNECNNTNLITLVHNVDRIEIINNTFTSNSLIGTGSNIEGGGVGLCIKKLTDSLFNLDIKECIFEDNSNSYVTTDTDSNQGGALHICSTLSTELLIQTCQFKGNKCTKGNGGAISAKVNRNINIRNSTFENNVANNQGNFLFVNQESEEVVKLSVTECKFVDNCDNVKTKSLLSGTLISLLFDSCEVKYSNVARSNQAFLLTVKSDVTLANTDFINCSTTIDSSVSFNQQKDESTISIYKCNFLNCKSKSFVVQLTGGKSVVSDCTFVFDSNEENSACGGISSNCKGFSCTYCTFTRTYSSGSITVVQTNTQKDAVDVSNCIFDDCGGKNTRCFNINTFTTSLTFSNNVIKNMKPSELSYFGSFKPNDQIDTLEMRNITFIDNACNTLYGDGTGLWVTNTKTFYFNDCKFINNVALNSTKTRVPNYYYPGDGGGFQYGFSKSIHNINLKFENCLFSRNKAVRHGGAISLQTSGTVDIISCIFEENVANYKPPSSSSSELLSANYYTQKSEGRGGAIYINPSFNVDNNPVHMISINIEKCTFTSNSAFDGFAIYIEGDDDETTFNISGNKFTNNYDGTENSDGRGVIITEINKLLSQNIEGTNTFEPYSNRLKIYPIIFVDHDARTPAPTPMASPIEVAGNCEPNCYYVGDDQPNIFKPSKPEFIGTENLTGPGSAIYIINAGCNVVDSTFTDCKSPNHGGGAIYIDTEKEHVIQSITIENTEFKECKASYGGAIYVRSVYESSPVLINNCNFESNEVTAKNKRDSNLFGGSAVYLHVRSGNVFKCTFNHNKGKGGAMKILNDFDDDNLKANLLDNLVNSVVVSDCSFEINDEHSSSVYYYGGKFGSAFELRNCLFSGELNNNNYHIDGLNVYKDSQKLKLLNCRFSDDYKSSLNMNGNYLSVNLKDQVFNANHSMKQQKENSSSFKIFYVAGALAIVALLAVTVSAVIIKKKYIRSNKDDENNDVIEESL